MFVLSLLSCGFIHGSAVAADCMSCHDHIDYVSRKQVFEALSQADNLSDNSLGVQNRGELSNFSCNYGDMADYHIWGIESLHWPSSAGETTQYGFGLGLVVATPGNVIESCINPFAGLRDWTPVEGSLGRLNSGEPTASDGTPYMAHSNYLDTWPTVDSESIWPGFWREEYIPPNPNPRFPTRPVPGEFTSDSDTYCEFDDRENSVGALGIQVKQVGFSYGRPYANDHIYWRSWIYNRSAQDLDSVYVGYYVVMRPDYDMVDAIAASSTQEMNLEFGVENDVYYIIDQNNQNDGAWSEDSNNMGIAAFLVLETPDNLGVTDFHHFSGDDKPASDAAQWAIISSNPDTNVFNNPDLYFHPETVGDTSRIDSCSDLVNVNAYGDGTRINYFVMTGPLTIAAGDSVVSSCASVLGDAGSTVGEADFYDVNQNIADAWDIYWKDRFAGPPPPPLPVLESVSLPGGAMLWWEAQPSESAIDFEGYRIYRSIDQGQTWGDPVSDENGRRIGWVPIAQFDLIDGITGRDPNGFLNLGNDSGLQYTYEDSGLISGIEYWYCITAYTTGLNNPENDEYLISLENPVGRSLQDAHTVAVVPGSRATNVYPVTPDYNLLQPVDGILCDGHVSLSVLDHSRLQESDWLLQMHTPLQGEAFARFDLIDLGRSDTLYFAEPVPLAGRPLPAIGGFRLTIEDAETGVKDLGWNESSPCNFDWWMEKRTTSDNEYANYVEGYDNFRITVTNPDTDSLRLPVNLYFFDYMPERYDFVNLRAEIQRMDSIQWTPIGEDAIWIQDLVIYFPSSPVSPEGWDFVPGGLAACPVHNGYEGLVDALVLRDNADPDSLGSELLIKTNNFDWIIEANGDTLRGVGPEVGDIFTVNTKKPFRDGVRYEFSTAPATLIPTNTKLSVRTVPDPYISGNSLENGTGGHRLMFVNLPAKCSINIYTMAGDHVRTLYHEDARSDTYTWDLRNKSRQYVAYGLYVFHVKDATGNSQVGRFMIIR
jgi:hypothetical protein